MDNSIYKTKSIVEAGIISAIIIVLMLITSYMPFIPFIGTVILPLPVAILYVRHDLKVTILAILVSTIIIALAFNPVQALLSALSFSLVGLVLGYGIRKDKDSTITLLLLTAVTIISTVLYIVITAALIEKTSLYSLIVSSINMFNDALKQTLDIYKGMGMPQQQLDQFQAIIKLFTPELFINMAAASLILGAFLSSIINYIVAKAVLKRLGLNLKKLRAFTELYINSLAGAIIIMPIPLGVYLQAKKVPIGAPILTSGQIMMQYIFMVIGISVVAYFLLNRYKLTKGIVAIIIIAAFTNSLFATIFLYVGLADMIFDFRKINPDRILKK
ncbi:YybS family protein [Candidatus Clostridium radicumherbarum]|uniref:YybS family protein n=1 Tax=Candidatus Clostridium radicumherbarum TaxID=3381662 RepID=A0ABW8TUI6_9CLOT